MKNLLFTLALLIFACTDDEGNPCVYEPTLTTEAATDITDTSATLNGLIAIVSENCEVAPGEMQGFVYSNNPSPTNDDNIEVVYGAVISTSIEGLQSNTTYYVRAFITNTIGEFYGDEVSFTTYEITQPANCDGNPVPTIVYGTQEWTVENACNTTYRDGTPIPSVASLTDLANLTTGAWMTVGSSNGDRKIYNWYAVMGIHDNDDSTPNKEFAPYGWHVPSKAEWITLIQNLISNGYNYDGSTDGSTGNIQYNKIAKAMAGINCWGSQLLSVSEGDPSYNIYPNDIASNNSSGFNSYPDGYYTYNSGYGYIGCVSGNYIGAYFWTSTEAPLDPEEASLFGICGHHYGHDTVDQKIKSDFMSVRLVRY